MQADCYRYLDGMESLLQRLVASGAQVSPQLCLHVPLSVLA